MRIYIAGPMTGYPDLNFPAFHAAAARLRAVGHDAVNPAEINADPKAGWSACMRQDIAQLMTCEAVATLPGWAKSRGASIEVGIAQALEMPVDGVSAYLNVAARPRTLKERDDDIAADEAMAACGRRAS